MYCYRWKIDIKLRLSLLKPPHTEWLVDFYDHMASSFIFFKEKKLEKSKICFMFLLTLKKIRKKIANIARMNFRGRLVLIFFAGINFRE